MTASTSPALAPSLWEFAIATYEQPGIAPLCLRLQDEHACDVNLLLCCLWHGRYFGVIEEARLREALTWSGPWQERLVAPLRDARRWLKPLETGDSKGQSLAELRAQIKACELAGERLQLEKLEAILEPGESAAARHGGSAADAAQVRFAITANLTRLGQFIQADSAGTDDPQALPPLLESLVDCFCAKQP